MNQALLDEVKQHPETTLMRFTVEQYQRLIDDGVVSDGSPCELLDGYIFYKNRADLGEDEMNHSPRHSHRLAKLTPILGRAAEGLGLELYCQLPVQVNPYSAPEPDFSLVTPLPEEAADRHPLPQEVVLVVEVALSSLNRDRVGKMPIYARAGIIEYWIVNLADQQLEVFRNPDATSGVYGSHQVLKSSERILLTGPQGRTVELSVADIL